MARRSYWVGRAALLAATAAVSLALGRAFAEDAVLLTSTVPGYVPGIARQGIPGLRESDASMGVANLYHTRPGDTATALPSSRLTAASWSLPPTG